MDTIDLHVHSTRSDGTLSPSELVSYAQKKGLKAFALTDHDTIAGLAEAFLAAHDTSLEVVAGIEFSTEYLHKSVHIVGLDFEYSDAGFIEQLNRFQSSRKDRDKAMIQKMQEGGIEISNELLQAEFKKTIITRAHFARYLVNHGYAKDIQDAFTRFVDKDAPYYVPRKKVTPAAAVDLIWRCGGIPVLAHPMQYQFTEEELKGLLASLKEAGLMGIEVFYSTHTPQNEAFIMRLAKQYDLLPSGGSDFHGSNKPTIDLGVGHGNLHIPYHLLTDLRNRRKINH